MAFKRARPGAWPVLDAELLEDENAFVEGEHGLYVSTHLGVDVIGEPGLELGVPQVSEDVEQVRIESGRPRLGYDIRRDDAPGGGHQRARGQLHQGLLRGQVIVARLHQGQAQSASARPAPVGAGRARHRHRAGREGRGTGRLDLRLTRARPDRARARPP